MDTNLGLFWQQEPKKVKVERTPPERTWESPDYLPGIDEARAFNVPLFNHQTVFVAAQCGEQMIYDIECYPNYFLIAFMSVQSKKVIYFEFSYENLIKDTFLIEAVQWVISSFQLISFNGISYDLPILALALAKKDTRLLKQVTDEIILTDKRASDILRKHKVKKLQVNHIDIIEVCPLQASLKIYAGRIHAQRMQDLPFKPDTELSFDQIRIVRLYCINDLHNTMALYETIKPDIELRESMSSQFLDLRSKSDAQIAEHVISNDVERITGVRAKTPTIEPGTAYKYIVPAYVQFKTSELQAALATVLAADFVVSDTGAISMPKVLNDLQITLGKTSYRMGIGGLHSTESRMAYKIDEHHVLIDRDVASYYPKIILNLRLYPKQLGETFLKVYEKIVTRRLAAKARGDTREANSLKIVVNGSFGKLSSKYSVLYAPDLFLQVVLTGQLSLLLLIETLELAGITVISGNTDGVVIYCLKTQERVVNNIVAEWERITNFETEETRYKAYYSKDVNNYIAIYEKSKKGIDAKTKGAYAATGLSKNPTNWICIEAVLDFLTKNVPIEFTIFQGTDIKKYVSVRTVKGGAVKDGEYLGKSIRWYYSTETEGYIINALNGHQVPKSDGAKPLMTLPDKLPIDINYQWYVDEAQQILNDIAYS